MEHELRREISLQPAGSSQQNKKVGPRKIGTRLLYPQSVTVTSFCDTRTSDIPPPSLSATPHGRLHLMSTCSPPPQHRYQHSLYPHHKSRRKNPLPGLGVRAKITTFAHGVTPPATRSGEGKEPPKFGLRTRVLHFSENIGHLK